MNPKLHTPPSISRNLQGPPLTSLDHQKKNEKIRLICLTPRLTACISSYFVLFRVVSSYFVLFRLISSHFGSFPFISSHFVWFCLIKVVNQRIGRCLLKLSESWWSIRITAPSKTKLTLTLFDTYMKCGLINCGPYEPIAIYVPMNSERRISNLD